MAPNKNAPADTKEIQQAIESVQKNIKFKRMLVFSLKSVADLSLLGDRRRTENAYCVLDSNIWGTLSDILNQYLGQDQEIAGHVVRIIYGVAKALEEDENAKNRQGDLAAKKPQQLLASIIKGGSSSLAKDDTDGVSSCLRCICLFEKMGLKCEGEGLVEGVLALKDVPGARAKKQDDIEKQAMVHQTDVMNAITSLVESQPPRAIPVSKSDFPKEVVESANGMKRTVADKQFADFCSVLFTFLQTIQRESNGGIVDSAVVTALTSLLDKVQSRRATAEQGSKTLAKFLGPEQLKSCLQSMKNATSTEDMLASLVLLSGMAYIADFNTEVVAAGGMVPLCAVITAVATSFEPEKAADASVRGIIGACKVLKAISQDPTQRATVIKEGVVPALVSLSQKAVGNLDLVAAICDALTQIACGDPKSAGVVAASGIVQKLWDIVGQPPATPDKTLLCSGLTKMTTILVDQNSKAMVPVLTPEVEKKIAASLKIYSNDSEAQEACLKLVGAMLSAGLPCPGFRTVESLNSLAAVLDSEQTQQSTCLVAVKIFEKIIQLESPNLKNVESSNVPFSLLTAAGRFNKNAQIKATATSALESIASEANVLTAIKQVNDSIPKAKSEPEQTARVLAGLLGLASISRLRPALIENKCSAVLLNAMEKWTGIIPVFEQQQDLISNVAVCLSLIVKSCHPAPAELDSIGNKLMAVCASNNMKALVGDVGANPDSKQAPGAADKQNCLVLILSCLGEILTTEKSTLSTSAVIELVMSTMRKFGDNRSVQCECIKLLTEIASLGDGAKKVLQSGATKQVLAYMQRAVVYEDVQKLAIKLFITVAKKNESCIDGLRKNGVMDVMKTIGRTHSKNMSIQKYIGLLSSMLSPEEFIQSEVQEYIQLLDAARKNRDVMSGSEALMNLANLTINVEAAKSAARAKLSPAMNGYFDAARKTPAVPFDDMNASHLNAATVLGNISHVGKPHSSLMLKGNALDILQMMIEDAMTSKDARKRNEGISACLTAATSLLNNERAPLSQPGAEAFADLVRNKILPQFSNELTILPAAIACMAVLDNGTFNTNKDVLSAIGLIVNRLEDVQDSQTRLSVLSGMDLLLQSAQRDKYLLKTVTDKLFENDAVPKLIKQLEMYGDDEETSKLIRKIMMRLANSCTGEGAAALRKALMAAGGAEMIDFACKAFGRNLGMNMNDAESACATINLMNNMTGRSDRGAIESSGLLEQCQDLLNLHPNNKALRTAVGTLLQNAGIEEVLDQLFEEIIALMSSKETDAAKTTKLNELLPKLEQFIPVLCDDDSKAFGKAPEAFKLLALFAKSQKEDVQLVSQCATVSRRLAERFADTDSPYGAKLLKTTFLPLFTNLLNEIPSSKCKKSKPFVRDVYHMMAQLATETATEGDILDSVVNTKLLKHTYDLSEKHASDPDVVGAILSFLAKVATDKKGMEALEAPHDPEISKRYLGDDLADTICDFITKYKRSSFISCAGIDYLINHIANSRNGVPICLKDPTTLNKIERVAFSSPSAACKYVDMLAQIVCREGHSESLLNAIANSSAYYKTLHDDESVSEEDKAKVGAAMARLIEAMAENKLTEDIKSVDGLSVLHEILGAHPENLECVQCVGRAIQKVALEMPEMRSAVLRKTCNLLLAEAQNILAGDLITAECVLNTLATVMDHDPDTAAYMREIQKLPETLEQIEALFSELEPGEQKDMLMDLLHDVQSKILDASPSAPTLEDMYRKWCAKVDQGETLLLTNNSGLLGDFEFVVNYTTEYAQEQHASTEQPLAREFMFGCHCLQLLMEHHLDNVKACVAKGIPECMLGAIKNQKVEQVAQWAVEASLPGLTHVEGAKAWSEVPNAALITVEALKRIMASPEILTAAIESSGLNSTGVLEAFEKIGEKFRSHHEGDADQAAALPEIEVHLIQRLDMMGHMAVQRTFYNHTSAMDELISIWDLFDNEKLTVESLIAAMRVMRKIVNDSFLEPICERQVPERLLMIVDDEDQPHRLLVDTLFLCGALAVVPEMKSFIGELEGVEKILELLKRCQKKEKRLDCSKTQQNACLALANIVMGHGKNSNKFGNNKGINFNIKIMEGSMSDKVDYDLANAASVLMCNLCFKRDDFKESFGAEGAPEAVILTIQKYDGADSTNARRCLISMFKAIANLALIPKNVERFVAAGLAPALVTFFGNCHNVDDDLMQASMKTLSNLVLEFFDDFMHAFAPIIPEILRLLAEDTTHNSAATAACFEVLWSLCRHESNQQLFMDHEGVRIVLGILNVVRDSDVYTMGLNLLATISRRPDAAKQMLDSGVINFVLALLDEMEDLEPDVIASGLRCLKKVMVACPEGARVFPATGGTCLLAEVICSAVCESKDCPFAMATVMEGLKIILLLFDANPSQSPDMPDLTAELGNNGPATAEELQRMITQGEAPHKGFPKAKSLAELASCFKDDERSGSKHEGDPNSDESDGEGSSDSQDKGDGSKEGKLSHHAEDDAETMADEIEKKNSDDLADVALDGSPERQESATQQTGAQELAPDARVYKPLGPRRWQLSGLDQRYINYLTRSLLRMLLHTEREDDPIRADKVSELAMTFMTHCVTEKIDGIHLPYTETEAHLSSFTYKIYGKAKDQLSDEKLNIMDSGTSLIGNLLCLVDRKDVLILVRDPRAPKSMKSAMSCLSPKKNKDLKRKIEDLWTLLQLPEESLNPKIFNPLASYDFPPAHTELKSEKYPNGVQDLTLKIRSKIRKGGKATILEFDEEKNKPVIKSFYWRSSPDMMMLTWMSDKKMENYNNRLQICRVKSLERGIKLTSNFEKYAKEMRVWDTCSVGIIGNPSPCFPDGVQLSVMFRTRRAARHFFTYLKDWNEAATLI